MREAQASLSLSPAHQRQRQRPHPCRPDAGPASHFQDPQAAVACLPNHVRTAGHQPVPYVPAEKSTVPEAVFPQTLPNSNSKEKVTAWGDGSTACMPSRQAVHLDMTHTIFIHQLGLGKEKNQLCVRGLLPVTGSVKDAKKRKKIFLSLKDTTTRLAITPPAKLLPRVSRRRHVGTEPRECRGLWEGTHQPALLSPCPPPQQPSQRNLCLSPCSFPTGFHDLTKAG